MPAVKKGGVPIVVPTVGGQTPRRKPPELGEDAVRSGPEAFPPPRSRLNLGETSQTVASQKRFDPVRSPQFFPHRTPTVLRGTPIARSYIG